MKKTFTKEEMNFRKGCYSEEQLNALSFMKSDSEITIESILNSEISLKDKGWFIRNSCDLTLDEKRHFAIGCALYVLPIYESKYPENKAPREAIEAAKAYLKKEIGLEELGVKRRAASASASAASAYAASASASAASAYAASASAYAADAASAYAASASASAASAYAYAASASASAASAYAADAAAASDAADADAADADAADADAEKPIPYKDLLLQFFIEFTNSI